MSKKDTPQQSNFLLYTSAGGDIKVDVYLQDDSVWLTQNSIATLFGVQRPAITKHLKNIFDSGELDENSVSSILEHTAAGKHIYKARLGKHG